MVRNPDIARFLLLSILVIFAACWPASVHHMVFESTNTLAYPSSLYANPNYQGTAAGADFGQVYFGARAWTHGESPYFPTSKEFRDPLERIPAYPALTFFLVSAISGWNFPAALGTHLSLEISLFLLLLLVLAKKRSVTPALAAAACIFFTPVGLTFLQQGQFDLYVAAAFLLSASAVGGKLLPRQKYMAFALAGLLMGIKWTAVPLFIFISGWDLVVNRSRASLMGWFIFVATAASFPNSLTEYFRVLAFWERQNPAGLSFHHLTPLLSLPDFVPEALFLLMCGLAIILGRKNSSLFFSFLAPLAIFSVGLGKMAFEYRTVGLVGIFAAMAISEKREIGPANLLRLSFVFFFLFSLRVFPFQGADETTYSAAFFLAAMVLFAGAWKISTNATKANVAK